MRHFFGCGWRQNIPIKIDYGRYKGVIKREAVYKCSNKDYLPEAQPSKGKMHCPRT